MHCVYTSVCDYIYVCVCDAVPLGFCLCTLQCLQHLDMSVLGELVPKLCDLLKSGVGLGTKVNDANTF